MGFTGYKLTDGDFTGKGISPLPKYPAYTTPQMQAKFDELVKDVVTPRYNSLIDALSASDAAAELGVEAAGIAADNVRDALAELRDALEDAMLGAGQLPPGGGAGQVAKKQSGASFDVAWADTGDMSAAVYDPQNRAADAFAAANTAIADAGGFFQGCDVETALQEAAAATSSAQATADAAMPKAGGTFSGPVDTTAGSSATAVFRRCQVNDAASNPVLTEALIFIRK